MWRSLAENWSTRVKVLPHRPFSETDGDQLDDTDREAQPCNLLPSHVHVGSDPNVRLLRRMGWSVGTAQGITASHGAVAMRSSSNGEPGLAPARQREAGRDVVARHLRERWNETTAGRRDVSISEIPAVGLFFPELRPLGAGEYLTVHFTSRPVLAG